MAYTIEELICEVEENQDGIDHLMAIVDQCERKIRSIQYEMGLCPYCGGKCGGYCQR